MHGQLRTAISGMEVELLISAYRCLELELLLERADEDLAMRVLVVRESSGRIIRVRAQDFPALSRQDGRGIAVPCVGRDAVCILTKQRPKRLLPELGRIRDHGCVVGLKGKFRCECAVLM